ncbi:hypothetical protein VD0004_g9767 [Verticillium dahliae]|nr:hypothetical protein VD0004_g9767 [Verticillium dahliae]PNH61167.1 hypothetical protein VD0001_g9745 [Verticillium dahliae]
MILRAAADQLYALKAIACFATATCAPNIFNLSFTGAPFGRGCLRSCGPGGRRT